MRRSLESSLQRQPPATFLRNTAVRNLVSLFWVFLTPYGFYMVALSTMIFATVRILRLIERMINIPPTISTLLICIPLLLLILIVSTGFAVNLGAPVLIMVDATLWLIILTEIQVWSTRLKIPILTILLIFVAFFSCVGFGMDRAIELNPLCKFMIGGIVADQAGRR
jgi:hypothetical protein